MRTQKHFDKSKFRDETSIAYDFARLSFAFKLISKQVNAKSYEMSDQIYDQTIKTQLKEINKIETDSVPYLIYTVSTSKAESLIALSLNKCKKLENAFSTYKAGTIGAVHSKYVEVANILKFEISLNSILIANGNLNVAMKNAASIIKKAKMNRDSDYIIFNSAAAVAQADGVKLTQGRNKKLIFCCKNDTLFTAGKGQYYISGFERAFFEAFKNKAYDCSFEYYFQGDKKNQLCVYSGNTRCPNKSKFEVLKETNMYSAIESLANECDCDLYFYVDYQFVRNGDDLLDTIVKNKSLKQLSISSAFHMSDAYKYVEQHNGSFKGTTLTHLPLSTDNYAAYVYFEKEFSDVAKSIEDSKDPKTKTDPNGEGK